MSKFKEWFVTTPGSQDPDIITREFREAEYRNTWLAAMREAVNMQCQFCRKGSVSLLDKGKIHYHREYSVGCYADSILHEIEAVEKGEQMSKKYWTGSVDFRSAVAITKEHKLATIDEVEEFVRTKMLPHWPSEIEPLEFFDENGRVIEGKE